jgi:hypothetical protein
VRFSLANNAPFPLPTDARCQTRQALEARIRRDLAAFRGGFTQYDLFNEVRGGGCGWCGEGVEGRGGRTVQGGR